MQQYKFQQWLEPGSSTIEYGHTSFSVKLIKDHPDLAKKQVLEKFEGKRWNIFLDQQKAIVLPYVQKTQCQGLGLFMTAGFKVEQKQKVIELNQLITHIDFSHLKVLQFSQLRIKNFQALAFLKMECLEDLNIISKNIHSLKSLNKINWPKLTKIFLKYENPAVRVDFSRSKFNKSMRKLYIGFMCAKLKIEDIRRLIKLEVNRIQFIELTYDFQIRMWKKFMQRF